MLPTRSGLRGTRPLFGQADANEAMQFESVTKLLREVLMCGDTGRSIEILGVLKWFYAVAF